MLTQIRGPRYVMPGTVVDIPFQAKFSDMVIHRMLFGFTRRNVVRGILYRDSNGRMRQDLEIPSLLGTDRIGSIFDVVEGFIYVLNFRTKTFVAGRIQSPPLLGDDPLHGEIVDFEGWRCRHAVIRKQESTLEVWISEELKHLIFEQQTGSKECQ